jgi:8-amino-7-oxononanoate synthase
MHEHLKNKLAELKAIKGLRYSRALNVDSYNVSRSESLENSLVNFSSNDYLGLASDLELQKSFFDNVNVSTRTNWMSSSSARPLTGTSLAHDELECLIAFDYGKEKALLFNSGYHANTGILPAITNSDDLILADKLVHASIIDGLRLGSAKFKRFAHNDITHLEALLVRYRDEYQRIWIVTESVFSMDGDVAPISEMVSLKKKYDALLYVDEAHAVGCYGEKGLGLSESMSSHQDVDLIIGVFGKALAGMGAYAVSSAVLIDSLINFSRSWLFSTALPPLNIEWNLYIWSQLKSFQDRRNQLQSLTTKFRQNLADADYDCHGETYIVPVMPNLKSDEAVDSRETETRKESGNVTVVNLSNHLEQKGFLALPIRSPTVKSGSERVRFSLTANIPEQCVFDVVQALLSFDKNSQ